MGRRPGRAHARGALGALTVCVAALAGCFADPTEVVVVVDTNARPGVDFQQVQLSFGSGGTSTAEATTTPWPVTVGVRQMDDAPTFDVIVNLMTTDNPFFNPMGQGPPPFATRKASDVRFVDGEMRVLFIPILKSCACVDASGMPTTSCPHALDPDCHDLTNPQLGDFDEDDIPRLPASAKQN